MSTFAFPSLVPDCEQLRKAFGVSFVYGSEVTSPSTVPFAVAEACAQLKAFEGWGTNVGLIISILANRNAAQRKLIRQIYAEIYGVDLLKPLDKELSSDFERVVLLWALDPAERDAILANEAVKRGPSSNRVLVEIACTRSSHELHLARQAYEVRFKKSLEEDVASHTTGNFRELLLSLVRSNRYSGDEVDMTLAKSDAMILHEKISKKAYSDDGFIRILALRSKAQINATLNEYKNEFGNDINKDLKADLNCCQFNFRKRKDLNEFLAMLRTTVKCLTYPEKYFEKVLRLAINKEGGRDGGVLTRVVTTRAKVDMKTIKDVYQKRNDVPLDRAIVKNNTIGDYEKMLLTLIRHGDA